MNFHNECGYPKLTYTTKYFKIQDAKQKNKRMKATQIGR
jgi:hypothetical protein